MCWAVKTFSYTGTDHINQGKPCQDYVDYYYDDQTHLLIGAVADGAGSYKYSDIGAKLAVETAIQTIKLILGSRKIENEENARKLFSYVVDFVRYRLQNKANAQGYSINNLSCTLLIFIVAKDSFAAMQIGDGLIVIRQKECEYELVFEPHKGECVNETIFITAPDAISQMKVDYKSSINLCSIFLTTDWCEDIAVNQDQNWNPECGFFEPLENCLLENKSKDDYQTLNAESIDSWIKQGVNNKTTDDKTLLICVHENDSINDKAIFKPVEEDEDEKKTQIVDEKPQQDDASGAGQSSVDGSKSLTHHTETHRESICKNDISSLNSNTSQTHTNTTKQKNQQPESTGENEITNVNTLVSEKLNTNNQSINVWIYVLVVFNLFGWVIIGILYYYVRNPIMELSQLGFLIKQPAIPIYTINRGDDKFKQNLWQSVWVLIPKKSIINQDQQMFNIDGNNDDFIFHYYKQDIPPVHPLQEKDKSLGRLPAGNYYFFDAKDIELPQYNEYQWVKILVILN